MTAVSDSKLSGPGERIYALDWLRVLAFLLLILYHVSLYFGPENWLVKNPESNPALSLAIDFIHRWRLPILFFISGAGVSFSLKHRSTGQYLRTRFIRLFIPLVFGVLFIVPPQTYFNQLWLGKVHGSYIEYWPTIFRPLHLSIGPVGSAHLWYVAYLFFYSLIGLPLFLALRRPAGVRIVDRLTHWLSRPGAIYLIAVPGAAAVLLVKSLRPDQQHSPDLTRLIASFFTFLWGYVLGGKIRVLDLLGRTRRMHLGVACAMSLIFFATRNIPNIAFSVRLIRDQLLAAAWLFTAIGMGRVYLSRPGRFLSWATEAVYPFYIVHQTITVALGYYMISWPTPIAVKLPLLAFGTLAGSWVVYELSRHTNPTRIVLGMKPLPPSAK